MRRPIGLVALLVVYLRWLTPALAPYAGGADSSGYLWSARLFRHATLSVPIRVPPGFPLDAVTVSAFVPFGARVRPGTMDLVPTYPTGFPLHIAALNLILPEEAAVTTVLVATLAATLWLLYVLARETGLEPWWALTVCVIFGCSPLVLFIAVQPMSDLLATCWAEAAVLCAWRARRSRPLAVLAGVSVGIAMLVRPTNLLLMLPIAVALPFAIRSYAAFATGALPFALFVTIYQTWAYGHPLESGYGDVSVAFSLTHVSRTAAHYLIWLPRLASWLLLCAPAALWAWRGERRRWTWIATAWIAVVFGVYSAYPVTSEAWWTLRFVLPAFPPLIIAAVTGVRELSRTRLVAGALAVCAVAICTLLLVRSPQFDAYRSMKDGEHAYGEALRVMAMDPSLSSTVLMVQMTGAANYYAPQMRFVRFDELSPAMWEALRRWQSISRQSIGAALFPFERDQLFGDRDPRFPCEWQPRGSYVHITFWQCPPQP